MKANIPFKVGSIVAISCGGEGGHRLAIVVDNEYYLIPNYVRDFNIGSIPNNFYTAPAHIVTKINQD